MDVKKIDSWLARGTKWVKEGQTLALEALAHLDKTGDIGPANRMVAGMPKGTKRNALAEWFLAFGRLSLNDNKAESKTKPFVYAKDKHTDVAGGTKKPWYDFQPEAPIVDVFDVQKAVEQALKSIAAKAAKAVTATNVDMLDKLREVAGMVAETHGGEEEEADPLAGAAP